MRHRNGEAAQSRRDDKSYVRRYCAVIHLWFRLGKREADHSVVRFLRWIRLDQFRPGMPEYPLAKLLHPVGLSLPASSLTLAGICGLRPSTCSSMKFCQ